MSICIELIKELRDKYNLSLKDSVDIVRQTENDPYRSHFLAKRLSRRQGQLRVNSSDLLPQEQPIASYVKTEAPSFSPFNLLL